MNSELILVSMNTKEKKNIFAFQKLVASTWEQYKIYKNGVVTQLSSVHNMNTELFQFRNIAFQNWPNAPLRSTGTQDLSVG